MGNRIAHVRGKFYDMGTTNKSFIQVAKDLHTLGIKNCYFMLEIYDPSLINIDPYAVDEKTGRCSLTRDQYTRVLDECMRNPWYFLREIVRIPEQGGGGIPYKANRGNIAQAWCILHHLDSWLNLPRQQGKTQSALAIQNWMYGFGTTNSTFMFINKSAEDSKLNLRRMGDQIRFLPEYMRFDAVIDDEGKKEKARVSATKMFNPASQNTIITSSKATTYDAALSLARGVTVPIVHFDECEFTNYIDVIVQNSYSAYQRAADNAIKNKAASSRVFTSTPPKPVFIRVYRNFPRQNYIQLSINHGAYKTPLIAGNSLEPKLP